MQITLGYSADQGTLPVWAKELQVSTRNLTLETLTCVNKDASACWIQLFNLPFSPTAEREVTGDEDEIVLSGHGFETGDMVTLDGDNGTESDKYVRRVSADRFTIHDSLADAQSGAGAIPPALAGEDLTVVYAGDAEPLEFPLAESPIGILSLNGGRFSRGLYVRAVTAADGATAISGDDVKFASRFMNGPVS